MTIVERHEDEEADGRPLIRTLVTYLSRIRVQLGGALLVAVIIPGVIRWPANPIPVQAGSQLNTMLGTALAIIFGYAVMRRLTDFPGTQPFKFVIPVVGLAHLGLIAILFFLRLEYSRFHILASFGLAVGWFYFVYIAEKHLVRPVFALLPFGQSASVSTVDDVDWLVLNEPALPRGRCSGIVADLRAEMPARWEGFLARSALKGLPVYHTKQVAEMLTGRVDIEHLSENNLGSLLPSSIYLRIKRGIDLLALIAVSPLLLVVCAAIAVAIRLEGGGPVLFRQQRMGFRGEPFTIVKFRSMAPECEGGAYTTDDDARVTRVGRVLRKYRLDELPQVINILRGEMSWIGPRPEAISLSDWYEGEVPFYSYRHIVRPGITGWAQVRHGYAAAIPGANEKLKYDFYYIKHFSFWLDLLIGALTIRVMLFGEGAR